MQIKCFSVVAINRMTILWKNLKIVYLTVKMINWKFEIFVGLAEFEFTLAIMAIIGILSRRCFIYSFTALFFTLQMAFSISTVSNNLLTVSVSLALSSLLPYHSQKIVVA